MITTRILGMATFLTFGVAGQAFAEAEGLGNVYIAPGHCHINSAGL